MSLPRGHVVAKRLRIVHIVRAVQTGGLEILVLELCKRMQTRDDLAASVYALFPGDGLEGRPEYGETCVSVLEPAQRRSKGAAILALAKMLRRARADVVHTHNLCSQIHGGTAAKLAGTPIVITTKHGWARPRVLGSRRLAGSFWRIADVVVGVSEEQRDDFVSAYKFAADRTRVVLNGVDTNRFRPGQACGDERGAHILGPTKRPVLGTVCRLVDYKGISTLLDAFGRIRRSAKGLPNPLLVIVGDGPDRATFEAEAQRFGVAEHVLFLGKRKDVANLYSLFDIFVLPSYTEGLPLTVLEAASCALPIVATRVGGNPEIIKDGHTGLLVAPRKAEPLAAAVVQLWRHYEWARAMGRAAREHVVQKFSIDRTAEEYLQLYQEVLRAKSASKRKRAVTGVRQAKSG